MARTKSTARRSLPVVSEAPDWGAPLHTIRHVTTEKPPIGTKPEYKRVDQVYDKEQRVWVYRDCGPVSSFEEEDDIFSEYCFTVNRQFDTERVQIWVTTIHIKNPLLKSVLQQVVGSIQGANWNTTVPKVDPQILLMFLPALDSHLQSHPDEPFSSYLKILLEFLVQEYSSTLDSIRANLSQSEITFQLLWALLIPRTTLLTTCPIIQQTRAVRLNWAQLMTVNGTTYYNLTCEYIDSSSGPAESPDDHETPTKEEEEQKYRFGHASMTIKIPSFRGACRVTSLAAYPIRYHANPEGIKAKLITRGRKWFDLCGRFHVHYSGLAYAIRESRLTKIHISGSRIMVDKITHRRINSDYPIPQIKTANEEEDDDGNIIQKDSEENERLLESKLTEGDLLVASPILYGFSLVDKLWLEFNVENISPIVWNDSAFQNLVLPPAHKSLIKALIESYSFHGKGTPQFDDFITGKGRGLVINAFGPPGTGKTMSAEATSEHVRKPLYIVGAGDLGTYADPLDKNLTQIFDIAHAWNAVVLIDEADVFLEQRSVHDLDRNALVAVFLRQLEYFSGILFITTNRVKTFDEAFQSRIHISLRYNELAPAAKRQIWAAFLSKAGVSPSDITDADWEKLGSKKVNGRQIKNAVRTGIALAGNRGVGLGYGVLNEVLEVMEQFEADFNALDGPASNKRPYDEGYTDDRATKKIRMLNSMDEY